MVYSNTSRLKAIFDHINESKFFAVFNFADVFFFLLALIFGDQVARYYGRAFDAFTQYLE